MAEVAASVSFPSSRQFHSGGMRVLIRLSVENPRCPSYASCVSYRPLPSYYEISLICLRMLLFEFYHLVLLLILLRQRPFLPKQEGRVFTGLYGKHLGRNEIHFT